MKRPSEGEFGEALRRVDLPLFVYKPPDDARNRKPCDFMVWSRAGGSTWFEVKDIDAVNTFSINEFRPAQKLGIREADSVRIPYWVAVYWRRHGSWTISRANMVMAYAVAVGYTGISRELLMSRFGIESSPKLLASTLTDVLTGEVA